MRVSLCFIAMTAFVIALPLSTRMAQAAQCGPHDDVAAALKQKFGEVVQVQGLSGDGRLMEIWANPKSGTWTATMTTSTGIACLSAYGDHFQSVKPGDPA